MSTSDHAETEYYFYSLRDDATADEVARTACSYISGENRSHADDAKSVFRIKIIVERVEREPCEEQ